MTSSSPMDVPVAVAADVVPVALDPVIVTAVAVVVGSTIDTVEPVGPNICLLFITFIRTQITL